MEKENMENGDVQASPEKKVSCEPKEIFFECQSNYDIHRARKTEKGIELIQLDGISIIAPKRFKKQPKTQYEAGYMWVCGLREVGQ